MAKYKEIVDIRNLKIVEEKLLIKQEDLDAEPRRFFVILAIYNAKVISRKYALRSAGMFTVFTSDYISKGILVCES